MKEATIIDYCAYHICNNPCSNELRSIGGCMCNTMNWGKASGDDAIVKNKLMLIKNK